MLKIPMSFSDEGEAYLTLKTLNKFLKERKLPTNGPRHENIKEIESYANRSDENKKEVSDWLDLTIKEGMKYVYLYKIDSSDIEMSWDIIDRKLSQFIVSEEGYNLINFKENDENLKIIKYLYSESSCKVSIWLSKLVTIHRGNGRGESIIYPIFIDIYLEEGYMSIRGKSKSGIFEYMKNGFIYEQAQRTTVDKEIKQAKNIILDNLGFKIKEINDIDNNFKERLYKILDDFTQTPDEINILLENVKDQLSFLENKFVNDICPEAKKDIEDVRYDLNNMAEKYFSINYPDNSIFTLNRDGYPLRIMATDEEESKVEQSSNLEYPLQSKAVFFDNKKMLQKTQLCDRVVFKFYELLELEKSKQLKQKPKHSFKVDIGVKKDYILFKFTEYTWEEDIENVLFKFIDN